MGPAHWDDAAVRRIDAGPVSGTAQDLGTPAGCVELGLTRWRADPGCQTTPVAAQRGDEEIAFVVAGGGRSWQDGAVCEVRAGDCVVHLPGDEAHTLVAGDDGLDVLSFGERIHARTALPRAEVAPGPAAGRVDAGSPGRRPANVVHVDDVEAAHRLRGRTDRVRRDLGRAAGSVRTGLAHLTVAPGAESAPPHVHSAEEELFVVLDGTGTLVLGDDEHPLRTGSVVARPAGSKVAHTFVGGEDGLVLLAFGQRDPRDIAWYPRSHKVYVRGIGVMFRVAEPLDYWDGEE